MDLIPLYRRHLQVRNNLCFYFLDNLSDLFDLRIIKILTIVVHVLLY